INTTAASPAKTNNSSLAAIATVPDATPKPNTPATTASIANTTPNSISSHGLREKLILTTHSNYDVLSYFTQRSRTHQRKPIQNSRYYVLDGIRNAKYSVMSQPNTVPAYYR